MLLCKITIELTCENRRAQVCIGCQKIVRVLSYTYSHYRADLWELLVFALPLRGTAHTNTYTHTNTYMQTYIPKYMYICIHTNTCIHTYIQMFRYVRVSVFIYIYNTLYACVCAWSIHMCMWSMGWLRLVGSLKLEVAFAEYRLFYRALLQKRPRML